MRKKVFACIIMLIFSCAAAFGADDDIARPKSIIEPYIINQMNLMDDY